ncbi:hypothetical protein C8A03DRAFT_15864 [Achaetomium macrosporum]|uniref:Myb-like domain-containing protein n=1 Tax=Achaetomium macrosporum TaxID=79813 RepID=A0AAN7C9S4_9PEZI|nr:hypothetical protein C8A03DRAFT_15864 [Achaetomium macrosporum]
MTGQHVSYLPTSDTMNRHEYGITKNRKTAASTGGGRAWSEDEEAYLLQTRLQKMPYKHIASHLKKTELACRLHYHQLSHGSNRRKRTTSISSGSSASGHSPVLHTSIPSPIQEHAGASSRSVSPPESAGSYDSRSPGGIQLPSIMSATASTNTSPRLPTILPKPASMTLALASLGTSSSTGTASPTASHGYPASLHDNHSHNIAPVSSTRYGAASSSAPPPSARGSNNSPHPHGPGRLRLDCSALPPAPSAGLPAPAGLMASHPVDMARLTAIYNAHRASFWAAVAADYGPGANPLVLEQAWRGTAATGSGNTPGSLSLGIAAQTPITPVGSPDDQVYGAAHPKSDKTRISAILGIDANPRSPSEREMVRRLEEDRDRGTVPVGVIGA